MARAKKLPSGQWRTLIYSHFDKENNKRVYESFTAETKKESEFMAAEFALNNKERPKQKKSDKLFSSSLSAYIELKEPVLSPATIRGYRNIETMLNKNYSDFCFKKIINIEQEDVQCIVDSLSENKSPKTVRNYHGLISAVLSSNGSNLSLKTSMPQKVRPTLYIPSDGDIQRLLKAVSNTELEIPVMLGAFCTMRRGEICSLSMDDINGSIIHIHHSMVLGSDKQWHIKPPKTVSSDRYIDAPPFVIDRINELGRITNLNPHSITIMFQRILSKNEIPHFRFHDLRHYSASIKHALGIPDAYIMKDGGWSSDKVLNDIYRHALSDRRREMSSIANEHFTKLCNTKCNTK